MIQPKVSRKGLKVQLTVSFLKEDGFVVKSARMLVDVGEDQLSILNRAVMKCWGKSWEWLPSSANRKMGFVTKVVKQKRVRFVTSALYPEIKAGWK